MSRCHIAWIFAKHIPHGVGNRTNPCELPGVLVLRLEFNICEQKSCWIWTVGFLEPTLKDVNTRYQSLATPRTGWSFQFSPWPRDVHLSSVHAPCLGWAGSWWYVAVGEPHGFGPRITGCCGLWTARSHWPCLQCFIAQKAQIWQTKVPLAAQQLFANLQCQPGWDRVLSHAGHLVGLQFFGKEQSAETGWDIKSRQDVVQNSKSSSCSYQVKGLSLIKDENAVL